MKKLMNCQTRLDDKQERKKTFTTAVLEKTSFLHTRSNTDSKLNWRKLHTIPLQTYHNALIICECTLHDSSLGPKAMFLWLSHFVYSVAVSSIFSCSVNYIVWITDMWELSIKEFFQLLLEWMKQNTIRLHTILYIIFTVCASWLKRIIK